MEDFGCACSWTKVYLDTKPDNFKWIDLGLADDVLELIPEELVYASEGDSDSYFIYSEFPDKILEVIKEKQNV